MFKLISFSIRCLSCFFSLLAINDTFCQQPGELFAEKFNAYGNKALQEKLFVHTDKEFYVAGEILWFKIYYANGTTHEAMHLSKIAYVDVLDENNEPVLQAKISLKPGESNGSFYLPVSLNGGNYTLRAYTNWMKNFDEEYFFHKSITIVNTLKNPEAIPAKDTSLAHINFFPEGGNLVSGIQTRVGFIVTDEKGGINDCHGYIVNGSADTIASFKPLRSGIGSFDFTPLSGNSYTGIIVLQNGSVVSKALPVVYDNGYVMNVMDKGQQQITITIKRKKMSGEPDRGEVLLAAHTRQILKIAERSFINDNDSIRFTFDKRRFDKGITCLTLFNGNNKPVCERLIYIKPEQDISLNITSDQEEYKNRQKIKLSFNISGNNSIQTPFNLSASVFYTDILQRESRSNIFNYIWLASDIPGYIETPGYYFSNEPDVVEATDNLMLTYGWRRFNWDNVWKVDNSFIKYLPELDGHLVTGKVIDSRNNRPVGDINAYLSVPGYPFGLYASRSDSNGTVQFNVKNYYGNGRVIAQRGIGTDSFYTVNLLTPFAEKTSEKQNNFFRLTEKMKQQILLRSIGMQVQNIFTGDSLRNFRDPEIKDTLPFYGLPEVVYQLDDYKRFTTMEEVLREYVMEIGVGVRNGNPFLKIFNPQAHDFYDDYELVLLDGVPLQNMNKIFSYDPLKVRKLDVIQTRFILGQSVFNGIASFSTYDGTFDAFEFDPKLIAIDYAGLQLQREFYSPVYETKEQSENKLPDFRTTLLWAPVITTDKDGHGELQFYSSDRPGKYLVVLQGMNEKGNFVYNTTTFEVK